MALSTYDQLARAVLLRCPSASILLARQWVSFAFRRLTEKRAWSWLIKEGQFLFPALVNTGTVTVTNSSLTVTGAGTAWTLALVGRQFRAGINNPIYTIVDVDAGAQTLTLDLVWGGSTASAQGYMIYAAYKVVPSDFHSFISIVDTQQGWRISPDIGQDELDSMDPQRASAGQPWCTSFKDYSTLTTTPGLPRYEVWPHVQQQYVLSFLYEARQTDLEDSGADLPRYIQGNMLLEGALAECARWPGPSQDRRNPYYDLKLAIQHQTLFEAQIAEAMRQDEEVMMINTRYQTWMNWPFAPNDKWWQSHQPTWVS